MNRRNPARARRLEHEALQPDTSGPFVFTIASPLYLCTRCGEPIRYGQRYFLEPDSHHEECPS